MRSLACPSRDEVREYLAKAVEPYIHAGVLKGYPVTGAELDSVVALYDAYDAGIGGPAEPLKGGPDCGVPQRNPQWLRIYASRRKVGRYSSQPHIRCRTLPNLRNRAAVGIGPSSAAVDLPRTCRVYAKFGASLP